jgi:DNA repair protein RecN (Recombination protein N)
LDDFARHGTALIKVRQAWRQLMAAKEALAAAETQLTAVRQEEDFLRHAVKELDDLDPQPGEEAQLDSQRRLMQAAERIREDIAKALAALGAEGAEGAISDATRWLQGVADKAEGQLDPSLSALGRAFVELGEAQQGVEACLAGLSFNPSELELAEERLFALRALARKHSVAPDELGDFAITLRAQLQALDDGEGALAALSQALQDAQKNYDTAARSLSTRRKTSARALDKAMAQELAPLKMERAVFETQVGEAEPGPEGIDMVAFTVATNPGAPAGALNKIASGGELSRFLLALKVCLTAEQSGLTLIFDEIDRGVGGATADAVGRRLASLAEAGQVLVVTHSPQVAALGDHHWQVEKNVSGGVTTTTVKPLEPDQRTDEIARMLSGDKITEEARAAARALLGG